MIALAIALVLQAEAPPAQRMQDLVRLETAMEVCDVVGYAPLEGALRAATAEVVADLHGLGYSDQGIAELKSDARRVEGGLIRRETIFPRGADDAETRRSAAALRSRVNQRCAQAKEAFPQAFEVSASEGRVFFGHMGLWLDYPLVEEVAFYLQARGTCSSFLPAFDARDGARNLSRPLAAEPSSALTSLENYYVAAYRSGLDDASEFDQAQCTRLMRSADRALATAWSSHFDGSPPYQPLR